MALSSLNRFSDSVGLAVNFETRASPELLCKQREKHLSLSRIYRYQVSMIVREISKWTRFEFKRGTEKLVDLNIPLDRTRFLRYYFKLFVQTRATGGEKTVREFLRLERFRISTT